jgi:S-adenosylmethionine hydrolase
MNNPIVTLTTDFGSEDSYVGAMKGVILGICPWAQLVDISHAVPAQDLVKAALLLEECSPCFPPGTVHVCVVDPLVGTDRPAVALSTPQAFFVGPDNGIFGLVWRAACEMWAAEELSVVRLTESRFHRDPVCPTFHGRDIFAPVAAHLARGTPVAELGPPVKTVRFAPIPAPEQQADGSMLGQVLSADRFGNCLTNLSRQDLAAVGPQPSLWVKAGDIVLGEIRATYAAVEPGEPLALIGSNGRLELAVRNGSFGAVTGLSPGALVVVCRGD